MNKINLNGKEYIEYSEYEKLQEQAKPFNSRAYWVMEQANVMAIIPNREILEDEFEVKEMGLFREFKEKAELKDDIKQLVKGKAEKVKVSNSVYSVGYINRAIKTAKAYLGNTDLRIFLRFDRELNKFVENEPCLLVFDNLLFILAPRIEQD